MDSSNQVSNVAGGESGGWTFVSFSIPCDSQDQRDLSITGGGEDRFLLFAVGPMRNGDIAFHGFENKWTTANRVAIDCGSSEYFSSQVTTLYGLCS